MKLKFTRKKGTPTDLPTKDKRRMETIRVRLTEVSERLRQKELADAKAQEAAVKPRTESAIATKPSNSLRVKLTKKGAGNLSLNSLTGSGAVVPGSPAELTEFTWKGRRMHGRHLPVLQCNNCSISRVCPKFKAGYECAYLPYLNSHKVESPDDLVKYMKLMVGASMKRAQMISIIETANGGMPTVEASEALDMAFRQLKDLNQVMTESGEQTIEIEGDATIVGQIFGGMKMSQIIKETGDMKKADPVLNLPDVPLSVDDVRAIPSPDVSQDLLRDALLGAPSLSSNKKGLQAQQPDMIQGDITKTL